MDAADLGSLPTRELLHRCRAAGLDLAGLSDKRDLVDALMAHEVGAVMDSPMREAEVSDRYSGGAEASCDEDAEEMSEREAQAGEAEGEGEGEGEGEDEEEGDGDEEEEAELMRQALLMSTETEAVLSGLPVRELRARLQARGIPTVGLVEKAGWSPPGRWSVRSVPSLTVAGV